MARNRTGDIALLVFLAAGVLAGTWYLMIMRFSAGDIYPPYSSLRADPLGCKVLYDTFDQLDQIKVRRHYSGIWDLDAQKGETVFILGMNALYLGEMESDLTRLAAGGARVVVVFKEYDRGHSKPDEGDHGVASDHEGSSDEGSVRQADEEEVNRGIWNLSLRNSEARADSSGRYQAVLATSGSDLPGQISLTSPVYFDSSNGRWQVIYNLEQKPVMMQCSIGLGTIVLFSDSYPVSNEALRWELYPGLLSWLLSKAGSAVFVESHLGVQETQGVMTLLRKYRLTALLGCVAVIALLAVWKNAVPLMPAPDKTNRDDTYVVSEKDQFTGLVSLLKRNIDPVRAVRLCFKELRKSARSRTGQLDELDGILEDLRDPDGRRKDPVAVYNRITRKLSERT